MVVETVDPIRCQAEKPNGNSFMTLGGAPGLERCRNAPTYILVEKEPGSDGQRGAMSVCQDCFIVFEKQVGREKVYVFERIDFVAKEGPKEKPRKRYGDRTRDHKG